MEIDINSTCRTCLLKSDGEISIFEKLEENDLNIIEMVSFCTGLRFPDGIDYPKCICKLCAVKLTSVWKFIEMCKTSHECLMKNCKERKFTDILAIKLEIKEEFESPLAECDISDRDDSSFDPDTYLSNSGEYHSAERTKAYSKTKKIKKKKTPKTTWKCESCDFVAVTNCGLKKHTRRSHPEKGEETFPCGQCGKVFKRKSDRIVHLRSHSGERPFACQHCPQRFSQSGTLILHTRRHTGELPFRCPACPRLFSCHSSLRRHERSHSGERPFACERCGATFRQPGCLRQHAKVHSEARPHACPTCGRALKSRLALTNHLLTHGEKGFVCESCGKKFFVKANLEKHCKMMHRPEAGTCRVCSKACSDLQRHMESHSEELAFPCLLCQRSFRTRGNLTFHMTTRHHNHRKFKCDMDKCSQAFPKQSMLDFHVRKVHSNETPFTCQHCSNGFFRQSDLSRHTNTVHPNEKRIP